MDNRIYNFSPGPSTLPVEALIETQNALLNFNGSGIGIMEISHRSKEFMAVASECEQNLRDLLSIPDNYKVLFLQGGASSQFFMIPMNLLDAGKKATYLNTGTWSKKAIKEARLFGDVEVGYSSEERSFNKVPAAGEFTVAAGSQYLYYTSNNTIYGTQFAKAPESDVMLICDMSSDILSKPIDIEKYGLIFAGAQKNLGPAGVTIVIIREDLLSRTPENVPTMLRYSTHAEKDSMFNTPPTISIYVVGEVLKWAKRQGGVAAIEENNKKKAACIYDVIDQSEYYRGHAEKNSRSLMNISFNLPTPELEKKFIADALAQNMSGLKGHRSIGGCRASLYNAFPLEGAKALAAFMKEFEKANPA